MRTQDLEGNWTNDGSGVVWDDIYDDVFDTEYRFRLTFNRWNDFNDETNDGLYEEYTYIRWIEDSGEEWFVRKNLF